MCLLEIKIWMKMTLGNFAGILCLMEIKILMKSILRKFCGAGKIREHPVFNGNYDFDENDTGKISRASCANWKLRA